MKLHKNFKAAGRGIARALETERNLRIHFSAAGLVVFFAVIARIDAASWAVILVAFALVIGAELLNTAVEKLCDRVCPERDEIMRDAKDIAAGAVMFCAGVSVILGAIVFFREGVFVRVRDALGAAPWLIIGLAAYIFFAVLWIIGKRVKK